MSYTIIHFSQDFRKDKGQLGAFSRTHTLTQDGNRHIVFTVHFGDETVSQYKFDHLEIISFGIGKRDIRWRYEQSLSKIIGRMILSYLSANQIHVDLFWGHAQPLNYKILQFVKARLEKPLIWDVNTIWGLPHFDRKQILYKLYYYIFGHISYRKCTHLIAQTEKCKQVIHRSFGISNQKISVITNSVNLDRFSVRKQYSQSFSNRAMDIYMVGRFDELNGINFILDNIDVFDSQHVKINLVGTGGNLERIVDLQKSGKLKYHGVVPYNEMPNIFNNADLLLIPRIRCFGSNLFIPTKLLESMASGLLVLGSDVGGISEVIRDNQNGFLFLAGDPTDMINKINHIRSLDHATLQKISDSALLDIRQNYCAKNNFQKINAVYERMLTSSHSLDDRGKTVD